MADFDRAQLVPGLQGKCAFIVEPEKLATAVGSGEVDVLATPMMIAGMEDAAMHAVAAKLPPTHSTVGLHMDVYHIAPSPVGTRVECAATLSRISKSGKKLYFDINARDEAGMIGYGTHERVIIEKESFKTGAGQRRQTRTADAPQQDTGN